METRFITPEDKAAYDKFFAHHIDQVGKCKAVSKVCHYTTGDTLIKIFDSGVLWSTQIACLNDSKEALYAVDALLEVASERRDGLDSRFIPCLDRMTDEVKAATTETAGIFISCFSSEIDDLSQWRGYGGEAGYAIVFDLTVLRGAAAYQGDLIMPVLYGQEANQFLNDTITWAQNFYLEGLDGKRAPTAQEWAEDFGRFWLWHLGHFAPMIKDKSFEREKEWRLIHFLLENDVMKVRTLQRRSMMSVHLPMALRLPIDLAGEAVSKLLPIDGVIVGPTYNKRMSQVAVGDMLRAKGYSDSVKVETTNIPYRPYL
jgi:hypothetical protein